MTQEHSGAFAIASYRLTTSLRCLDAVFGSINLVELIIPSRPQATFPALRLRHSASPFRKANKSAMSPRLMFFSISCGISERLLDVMDVMLLRKIVS